MIYGYIRVSSDKQTVENQRFEINNFCERNKLVIDGWIEETISGTKSYNKRELGKLLKRVQKDDLIICAELSRLGRNLFMIMEILNICMTKECKVWTIKDNYRLGEDIQSKVLAFAFGLSAEIERNLISQRTREALARKKAEGITLGRPKGPILRGRDIKRYEYEWANLWIINTHNGIKGKLPRIHIEDYPAVKAHLDQYWDKISKRADKGDTPYNLRNCAYLEDFFKPKIIYPNMTKYMPFVYDNEKYLTNQKCFIITGCNVAYLTAFFNSSLFKYCFRDSFPELQGGTREMSKIFFDKIPVLKVTGKVNEEFVKLIDDIQKEFTIEKAIHIDERLFDLYNLSPEERKVIGFIEIN